MNLTIGGAGSDIVTRSAKGEPLSLEDHDLNLNNIFNALVSINGQISTNSSQLAGVTGGLVYKGTWDPTTGVLPLGGPGYYYVVNGAGTVGGVGYQAKDMILWNGTSWDKIDNTDSVVSVNDQTGAVVIDIPSGDYNDLTNKPVLDALHTHTNNIDQYPDPTGATTGQILIGGTSGLEYQAGYNKAQVDIALSYKLDASRYTGEEIQTKLGNSNLHVLDDDEYASIGGISGMITGAGTSGCIPAFTGAKQIANGFVTTTVVNDIEPGNTVIPLEEAVVNFVNGRIASNAAGVYRKANVLAIADYESAPPTTNEGDRYILAKDTGDFSSGSLHTGWGSVAPGDLVYYESGAWKQESGTTPQEGWTVFIEEADKYAVFCVGTQTKWAIGSIGRPVIDGSEDTDRSKLVSDKIVFDLNAHMSSDHSGLISAVVDKAYIESILTGPITSHSHAGGVSLQSETITSFEPGGKRTMTTTLPVLAIVETVYLLTEV
jgi:hypothetical protein